MWPRGGSARCRPIDISDAVGVLIGCAGVRGRQVGNSTSRPSRKEQPAEGVANRSRTDCVPEFSAACLPQPTRETGVEEQPAEGGGGTVLRAGSFLSFPRMPALPRRYRLAKRGEGIARRGGGEQFPGWSRADCRRRGCGAG